MTEVIAPIFQEPEMENEAVAPPEMVCPMSGFSCPGIAYCKPAMFYPQEAEQAYSGNGECPIVMVVLALQSIAYAAVKMANTIPDAPEQPPKNTDPIIAAALGRADQKPL